MIKSAPFSFWNESGAFLITKSGDKISKYFGISKYTLYSYIDINKAALSAENGISMYGGII